MLTDDKLLLCSDGVWDAFEPEALVDYLQRYDLEIAIEELLHDTETKMREQCDNISAICLRWDDQASPHKPLQDKLADTVDEKSLWEKARQKAMKEKIKAQKSRPKAPQTKTNNKKNPDKKRINNTIEELESYLSQQHRKD